MCCPMFHRSYRYDVSMNAADLITKPSPESRKFFLRVAKRANEMQRDLVKKARDQLRVERNIPFLHSRIAYVHLEQ